MAPHDPVENFEGLSFNPFDTSNNILLNNLSDPDAQFFNEGFFQDFNAPYYSTEQFTCELQKNKVSDFSVLHVNIRSFNQNFETFKNFLSTCKQTFSMR